MRCVAIIVNYHCANDTLAAVESIRRQDTGCAVWVVDNSADAGESERLKQGLPPGVNLLVSSRNLGFAAACNFAFRECDTEYVLLLNPDARLLPGALPGLIEALDGNPRLAAVAPATWWNESRQWLLPTLLPETAWQWLVSALASRWPQWIGRRTALRWLAWQRQLHAGSGPQPVEYLSGAVLLLRRSAVEAAGGLFDERFFMFYEDADLSRRLRGSGFRLALVPEAQAVHHWRNKAGKEALMAASATCYLAKNYPLLARLGSPFALLGRPPVRPDRWGGADLLPTAASTPGELAALLAGRGLLAVSPSPLGFPAAFIPAASPVREMDELLWRALEPGRHVLFTEKDGRQSWVAFDKTSALQFHLKNKGRRDLCSPSLDTVEPPASYVTEQAERKLFPAG